MKVKVTYHQLGMSKTKSQLIHSKRFNQQKITMKTINLFILTKLHKILKNIKLLIHLRSSWPTTINNKNQYLLLKSNLLKSL